MVPKTARNIAIGLALGVALGIGLAVLRDLLDNTVKDRETLEEITGVGLVGSIPLDKERRKDPAISFDKDNSAIAEAFRKLRTNLQFLAVDNPPRVIVVTSSMPNEGKSTTAINIALALAEAEHNVVLVDGDMRRPMLDKYLDLVGPVGFSTVLSGQHPFRRAAEDTLPGIDRPHLGSCPAESERATRVAGSQEVAQRNACAVRLCHRGFDTAACGYGCRDFGGRFRRRAHHGTIRADQT